MRKLFGVSLVFFIFYGIGLGARSMRTMRGVGFSSEISFAQLQSRAYRLTGKIITVSGVIDGSGYKNRHCPMKFSTSKSGEQVAKATVVRKPVYLYGQSSRTSQNRILLKGTKIRMKIMRCLPPYSFFSLGKKYRVTGVLRYGKHSKKDVHFFDVIALLPII